MEYFILELNNEEYEVEAEYTLFPSDCFSANEIEVNIHKAFKKDDNGDYFECELSSEDENSLIELIAEQVFELETVEIDEEF